MVVIRAGVVVIAPPIGWRVDTSGLCGACVYCAGVVVVTIGGKSPGTGTPSADVFVRAGVAIVAGPFDRGAFASLAVDAGFTGTRIGIITIFRVVAATGCVNAVVSNSAGVPVIAAPGHG